MFSLTRVGAMICIDRYIIMKLLHSAQIKFYIFFQIQILRDLIIIAHERVRDFATSRLRATHLEACWHSRDCRR